MNPRIRLAFAVPVLSALALTACSPAGGAESSGAGADGAAPLMVMASFYPLQYITEQVGGDLVKVESLTPPGTEPHDLELSPASVASLQGAAAVAYLSGFQPAVDDAIEQAAPAHVLDVSGEADLAAEHTEAHADEAHADEAHAEEAHAEEAHAEEAAAGDGHAEEEHGGQDLHFWLDPERLAHAAEAVAVKLGEVDPDNTATYEANAEALAGKLATLDDDFRQGLATCTTRTAVVSHEAYGYLMEKYDLKQVGIAGLEPETEPSPARLAEIGEVIKVEGVGTIFTETIVNPKVAETLAADLDIKTAVLDPLEGQANDTQDYDNVMRANLEALRTALGCS